MKETLEKYVLVLSVGGSVPPVIKSLKYYQPHWTVFVCSPQSRSQVQQILAESGVAPESEIITLSDPQDFLACVREIRQEMPKKLKAMNLPLDTFLITDFTGGTKVMSASLAIAVMEFNSRFSYVGGSERTKDGLGVVIDGSEVIMEMVNPWKAMGIFEIRDLVQAFNSGQFGAAEKKAAQLKENDQDFESFYDGLTHVIRAYDHWDKFNYRKALTELQIGNGKLKVYNNRDRQSFQSLFKVLRKDEELLKKLAQDMVKLQGKFSPLEGEEGDAYIRDLLANALRCGEQGRYDDAVARLYSAIEKSAKVALAKMGVDNSDIKSEELERMGGWLKEKYSSVSPDRKIQMPLTDSFLALGALNPENPLFKAYMARAEDLAKSLESRNMSLLAHGYIPVDKDKYNKLKEVALDFLGVNSGDLPGFPNLEESQIHF